MGDDTDGSLAKAAGIAAYGLATGILSKLNAKGILTDQDVGAIFSVLLSDSEKAGMLTFPEGRTAYQMLASLAATSDKNAKPTN